VKINLSRFLQTPSNLFICRMLGWRFTLYYLMLLGKLYFFVNGEERRTIQETVQAVLKQGNNDETARKVIRGTIFHYHEKLFNAFSSTATLRSFFDTHVTATGLPLLQEAIAKGKGALVITGHFGGVEFMPAYLGYKDLPVAIVAKFSTSRLRERSISKSADFNAKIIDPDVTPNVFREMLKSLKENRIVITQCDEIEEWRPNQKKRIRFLGQEIFPDKSMNIMFQRAKVPTFFALMHRDQDHRYLFEAAPIETLMPPEAAGSREAGGASLLRILEEYILQFPEEWYQWKKMPMLPVSHTMTPRLTGPGLTPALNLS